MSKNFFVFEVAAAEDCEFSTDPDLIPWKEKVPDFFTTYIEKSILPDLPEIVIVDFTHLGQIELLFISPRPNPIETYSFWMPNEHDVLSKPKRG